MTENQIQLNKFQRLQALSIFALGVREATFHMCKLSSGGTLFTRGGTEVGLGMAIKRRRSCLKRYGQALRGFVV